MSKGRLLVACSFLRPNMGHLAHRSSNRDMIMVKTQTLGDSDLVGQA